MKKTAMNNEMTATTEVHIICNDREGVVQVTAACGSAAEQARAGAFFQKISSCIENLNSTAVRSADPAK
jgi:hypothetical protein